ncbi:MAG: hypothetical protein IPJ34_39135 [Myxococcales bacterium]|nr:hypothetical protein [Myxococcales bacterium]
MWRKVFAVSVLALGCGRKSEAAPTTQPSPPPPTPVASAAPSVTAKPVCADLVVELPPLLTAAFDVAQPDIVDEGDAVMQSFYEKAARNLRKSGTEPVRIGVYGDSNMTMDYQTGEMRRVLQTRYGDAGHGFLAAGRPWGWYLHRDIKHDADGRWIAYDVSTDRAPDAVYGFANISMKSKEVNALSWLETVDDTHEIGRTFSKFEIYAVEQPYGGAFTVTLDGQLLDTIDTKAEARKAIFKAYDVKDTAHRLDLRAKGGNVRLFGTVVERPEPSFVVDSLGVGALNAEQLQHVDKETHKATLAHRKYDLILDMTGTNMFALEYHPKWMKNVIAMYRSAIPDVPVLLVSPPDLGHWEKQGESDPRVVGVAKQKLTIAKDEHAAYWDYWTAMGGQGAIFKFKAHGMAEGDLVHLNEKGGRYMGSRIAQALFRGLARWAKAHPKAGCPAS